MNSQITLQEPDGTYGIYLGNSAHDPLWFLEDWPGCWTVAEYGTREEKWSHRLYAVRTPQLADSLCNVLQDYMPDEYDAIYRHWLEDRILTEVEPRPYFTYARSSVHAGWEALPYRIHTTWQPDGTQPYETWVQCGYTRGVLGAYGDSEWSWNKVQLTHLPTGLALPNVNSYATAAKLADALSSIQGDFQFGVKPEGDVWQTMKDTYESVKESTNE